MTTFLNAAFRVLLIVGRIIIFIFLVLLALGNTHQVNFHLMPGINWDVPLILVLFIAFIAGILLTLLSGLTIRRLQQDRR
jgi:uncharacterized integral membrane protein